MHQMIVYLLEVCTLSKPTPWGEGGFKIFCKEILKTDVGKYYEFAGDPHKTQHISASHISQKSKIFDSFSVLWCDCHWQSMDFDSLRGAPPPGEA